MINIVELSLFLAAIHGDRDDQSNQNSHNDRLVAFNRTVGHDGLNASSLRKLICALLCFRYNLLGLSFEALVHETGIPTRPTNEI